MDEEIARELVLYEDVDGWELVATGQEKCSGRWETTAFDVYRNLQTGEHWAVGRRYGNTEMQEVEDSYDGHWRVRPASKVVTVWEPI